MKKLKTRCRPSRNDERTVEISVEHLDKLRTDLIDRVENIVLSILEQLLSGELPKISYKMTSITTLMDQLESIDSSLIQNDESQGSSNMLDESSIDETINDDSGIQDNFEDEMDSETESRRIVDFGQSRSRNTFALLLTTMAKLHELLVKNQTQKRRAFYYDLKRNEDAAKIIKQQTQIDQFVHTVANILDCPPCAMPLVASAKGFCAGNLKMTLRNNEIIDCNGCEGVSISPRISNVTSLTTNATFVLVVEKDTVFDKLLQENCPRTLNCILITGKGYPDMATRMLVTTLADKVKLPVYVLVDADPHGVEIMFTYKFGSINYSYEQGNLPCPSARWLGLHPSDLKRYKISTTPLEENDFKKLNVIKQRPYVTKKVNKQLEILRDGKAGIEAIIEVAGDRDLTTFYIQRKIEESKYLK